MTFPDLGPLVDPRSIAFVGASDRVGSIASRALENLLDHSSFTGELYLVNPSRAELFGRPCFPDVASLPEAPDLAILTVPASAALSALEDCARRGTRFAIMFTAGFGEAGEDGKAAEAEMKALVARTGMRIYGPNCPGLNNINKQLGFTFSPAFRTDRRGGGIGLATQGGALGRTVMQAMERGAGIGLWCSAGNEVDLEVSDFIHHMADAPDIAVIATIIEGVRNGPEFMAAALHAARKGKPIVALKIGRSDLGIAAAQSHTAAIAGSAEVNSAVFRQLGIIEVDDVDELIDIAALLARKSPSGDEGIAVYGFSGGAAALSADMIGQAGLDLAAFSPVTAARLGELLPAYAATANPVDTTGDVLSNPELSYSSLKAVVDDENVGIVLFPYTLDYGAFTAQASANAVRVQQETTVPILPVWMSDRAGEGYQLLVDAGLVPVRSLGKAVKALARWRAYGQWRKRFDPDWTPELLTNPGTTAANNASPITVALTEVAAKARLHKSGISVPVGQLCRDRADAESAFRSMGGPVVAKIVSGDITHKSDIGGVKVGIGDAAAAGDAVDGMLDTVGRNRPDAILDGVLIEKMAPSGGVELFVGVHRDPVFGHILSFGLGGVFIELFRDVSRRLLPLTQADARAMIREIRSAALLEGLRGKPPRDIEALEHLLMTIADHVVRNADRIEELEINPVWLGAAGEGAIALDAVLVERRVEQE